MSPTARAALIGAGLAVLATAAFAALIVAGVISLPRLGAPAVTRVLVIATAPEDDSVTAPFAFVMRKGSSSAQILDTSERVVVSGTSAESAREAYPFVGGQGVARALVAQTGGETLEWIVLSPLQWSRLVDRMGGLEVELPVDISVYLDGKLVVFERGTRTLSGDDAVALASAIPFLEERGDRQRVESKMSAGLSSMIVAEPEYLADLVAENQAESSLDPEELGTFATRE